MYITRISVRNDGPLKEFEFQTNPPFSQPRPIIITGPNGAGKTNLISILADAIIEGAAAHHPDVTTHSSGLARNWFRVVGGATQRAQTDGSYAIVEFDDGDSPLQFVQKAGSIESPTSDTHRNQITPSQPWVKDGAPLKQFYIDQETSQRIYSKGVYAFFPVSRSEKPHWLNSESLKGDSFTQKPKYTGMFGRHIYIEHPTEPLANWISQVIADSRPEVATTAASQYTILREDFKASMEVKEVLDFILQIILNVNNTHFRWISRSTGLHYMDPATGSYLRLSNLSSGQSTLLGIFGTLLWHGDVVNPANPSQAPGICIVDEIDAHVHMDLVTRAIPKLMRIFPNIQFILTSHSPFLPLGLLNEYEDAFDLIELPEGKPISPRGYSEFNAALTFLKQSKALSSEIAGLASNGDKTPLILMEGITDPMYIQAAATHLKKDHWVQDCAIQAIGKNAGGTSRGQGSSALDNAWKVFKDNPEMATRPILLVYDNDQKGTGDTVGNVSRVTLPRSEYKATEDAQTHYIAHGIEAYLHPETYADELYWNTTRNQKPNGEIHTSTTLAKTALADSVCSERALTAEDFTGFIPVLELLENWHRQLTQPAPPAEGNPGAASSS